MTAVELPPSEVVRAERPAASPWMVLASTSLAVFAVFLDTTVLYVAFPSIRTAFADVTASSLSWVLNAYTVVFAASLIPAGRLSDRIGQRRMFLGAVIAFTVASMLCGVAPTAGLLVAFRVLQALAAAALVPSSLALVLQTFPAPKVPAAVAIWGAVGAVAGAAGPTLGAFVVEHAGWRWAFYLNLPVGVVSLVLGYRVLPRVAKRASTLPDPVGVVLLVAAVALAAYTIVQTGTTGWTSPAFGAGIAVAAVLLVAFVLRCRRVPNPVLDLALFEQRQLRWANAATMVFSIAFNAMFLGNVLFFTQVWGYSIIGAGLAISVGPLIVAVTAPFFGRLAGRIGQRALLIPGGLVWAAGGGLLLLRVGTAPAYASEYLPAIVLTGLGVALCLPQLSSAAVQGLPPESRGTGSGVNQAIRNLGATVGVALVVAFTGERVTGAGLEPFHKVWWLLVLSGVGVSGLSLLLPRHASAPAAREPAPLEAS